MSNKEKLHLQGGVLVVQKHQLDSAQRHLGDMHRALEFMEGELQSNDALLDQLIENSEALLDNAEIVIEVEGDSGLVERDLYLSVAQTEASYLQLDPLDFINAEDCESWREYLIQIELYANRHGVRLAEDPFHKLMTATQRIELEKRIKEEFTFKGATCDKYDYMIAGTCGLIGGLVDIVFVGVAGKGLLTSFTDDMADKAVQKFAKLCGWSGPGEGKDPSASAIGFLERSFRVNYDHRHGGDVDQIFDMSTRNHHIKSLGHSPDLIGLFFSILDQFNNTAHFVSGGKIVVVETEGFELRGSCFISKLFSGFANWLGHLFSDVSGSSGAVSRGSGIPIPFYALLQFVNVGEFGQYRQTFGKIAVQVFEQGYDLRHGLAMAIPVLVTELLTRICWVVKRRFYHNAPWGECFPSGSNPELRRMLLVAHGSLCLVDTTDAALRCGGNMIQFMLRTNLIAWVRFGTLGLKEVQTWYWQGQIDSDAVNSYLEAEYRRILTA